VRRSHRYLRTTSEPPLCRLNRYSTNLGLGSRYSLERTNAWTLYLIAPAQLS